MAFISRFDNRKPKQPDDLVNERVRFKEVLVIDQNGDQLGVKSSREALDIAYDANLDLVCVAPNAKPPVCRIMDFGKYRFEQQKKAREMKKNSKVVTLKETQLSVTIDTHDKNVKLKRTGSGKLKRSHAYISHLSHNKTHKQKKHLAKATVVSASDYKRIKSRLPK